MSIERFVDYNGRQEIDRVNFVNERLGQMNAQDRIDWMFRTFDPRKIVLTTSGGETSAILPTLVSRVLRAQGSPIIFPVVFVDTGLNGKSTLDFVEGLSERGKKDGYKVFTYKPRVTLAGLSRLHPEWGEYGSGDFEKSKNILKKEPLEKAFGDLKAVCWASGPMFWETEARARMPIVSQRKDGLYAVHPIIDWTEEEARDYIEVNHLPVNAGHYDFFKGTDQKSECTIHV